MAEPTATASNPATAQRPPFDPELAPALDAILQVVPRFTPDTLASMRDLMSGPLPGMEPVDLTVGGAVDVEERQIPGPEGAPDVTVLILRPVGATTALPAIYHVHGGGMVVGTRTLGVDSFLPYVAEGEAVVVSVEYRLAPEHPDPAPIEDTYAGLVWTARHAAELGIDPDRIMIAGTSAGGGLAAGTALLARDRGFPELSHQILICPMLDDRFETVSSQMLDGEGMWDRHDNHFGWTALLGDRRGGPDVSEYAAPARAADLSGLPVTYLDSGSVETFRDEILIYAGRLSEAGVTVDLHLWGGGFHGSDLLAGFAAVSQAAVSTRDDFIRRALSA